MCPSSTSAVFNLLFSCIAPLRLLQLCRSTDISCLSTSHRPAGIWIAHDHPFQGRRSSEREPEGGGDNASAAVQLLREVLHCHCSEKLKSVPTLIELVSEGVKLVRYTLLGSMNEGNKAVYVGAAN